MEIAGVRSAAAARRRRCSTKSAWPSAAITIRRSSRAASSSASRSRGRSPTIRRCCSPTSRPEISTATTGRQVIELLLEVNRSRGTTLVLVTHDPELAARRRRRDRAARRPRVRRPDRWRRHAGGEPAGRTLYDASSSGWPRASCAPPGGGCCSSSSASRSASAAIVALRSIIQSVRAGLMREARALHRRRRRRPEQPAVDAGRHARTLEQRLADAPVLARTDAIETATMVRPESAAAVARMVELRGGARPASRSTARSCSRAACRTRTPCWRTAARWSGPELLTQLGVAGRRPHPHRRPAVHDPRRDRRRSPAGGSAGSASARACSSTSTDLRSTGLLSFGSRANYQILLKVRRRRRRRR